MTGITTVATQVPPSVDSTSLLRHRFYPNGTQSSFHRSEIRLWYATPLLVAQYNVVSAGVNPRPVTVTDWLGTTVEGRQP